MSRDYYNGLHMHIHRRRKLRRLMTRAEKQLWNKIRAKRINNIQFRRQHGIKYFIADFCHLKSKTVIEIDGSVHCNKESKEYDAWRTDILEVWGFTVIRFTNFEVYSDIDRVIKKILNHIKCKAQPSPLGEVCERQ